MWKFRLRLRPRSTDTDYKQFIKLAYRGVLRREPDAKAFEYYLKQLDNGQLSFTGLLKQLVSSEEFKFSEGNTSGDQVLIADPDLTDSLQACEALTREQFDRAWAEAFQSGRSLVTGQEDYAMQHRERFWELFNAVAILLDEHTEETQRLLEFGVSEYTGLFKRFWPELQLEVADRPVEDNYPGFNRSTSLKVSGALAFHPIDLEQPIAACREDIRDLKESFQVVLFTEVLEHLAANPVEVISLLLDLLTPRGFLYLTTPNFFRRENLQLIERRKNPQETYPAGNNNWDAHFHVREYCAGELAQFVEEAGGECVAFYYSNCWDLHEADTRPVEERSNLVFVIRKAASSLSETTTLAEPS